MNYEELLAENNRNVQKIKNLEEYIEGVRADAYKMLIDTIKEVGPLANDQRSLIAHDNLLLSLKQSVEILEAKSNKGAES